MPRFYVTGHFIIEAVDAVMAEDIVQNAVEATDSHIETDSVDAESQDGDED